MKPFWYFPSTEGGQINSINNAGIETFRGNELDSLTREICQNSLDAVKDESQPVVVEFKRFEIETNQFPNYDGIVQVYDKCEETWNGLNPKSEQFIKQAKEIMKKPTMQFLRVSDFNTKGLEGAQTDELGTPWSSLVRESGSSNKGDSSGGSFGIGKSAPFANSKIRTIFYESLDATGYSSHIGVANIMSYKKSDLTTTLGTGYYTKDTQSTAIPGFFGFDKSYSRSESGTDIYIAAFLQQDNWKESIRNSVLYNFFITIYQKKLVVHIEDEIISHENIGTLITQLDDSNEDFRHLKAYYKVLTSEKALKIPSPKRKYKTIGEFKEGEATLYIIKGEDLNRKVLMTRKAGMRLFEQNRISSSIIFTGILMITGKRMNQVFKEMENPAHNEWQPNRYEDPKAAEKAFKDLRKFVRESVLQNFQAETTNTMDAIGLNDFLPDVHMSGDGEEKQESITMKIKEVKQKKKDKPKKKKKKNRQTEKIDDILIDAGIENGVDGNDELAPHTPKNPDSQSNEDLNGKDLSHTGNDEQGSKEKKETYKPIDTKMRYLCMDKSTGSYRVNIKPEKRFEKGKIEFKVSGEQSDYELPIESVKSQDIDDISVKGNVVHFTNMVGKNMITLEVQVSYDHYCVLEVDLYEAK